MKISLMMYLVVSGTPGVGPYTATIVPPVDAILVWQG